MRAALLVLAGAAAWLLTRRPSAEAAPVPVPPPRVFPPVQPQLPVAPPPIPPSGTVRVTVRVYGEDGAWLKDAVLRVRSQDGRVLATVNFEELPGMPEAVLDLTPGTYILEAEPDPSVSHFYGSHAVRVPVLAAGNLRIVLPRRFGLPVQPPVMPPPAVSARLAF